MLFSIYGDVLQIQLKSSQKLRGQAFIVFRETSQAERALKTLNKTKLYGKEMVIF
jgi:U2 small nuclear ribonucleoprotein B''